MYRKCMFGFAGVLMILAASGVACAGLIAQYDFENASDLGAATVGTNLGMLGTGAAQAGSVYTAFGQSLYLSNNGLSGNNAALCYFKTAAGCSATPNSPYSVSLWFKSLGYPGDVQTFVSWGTGDYDRGLIQFSANPGFNGLADFGHNADLIVPDVGINSGAWHHAALVWDPSTSTKTIYFDGADAGSMSIGAGMNVPNQFLTLAARYDGMCGYTGYMDHVKIYNQALTADQVASLAGEVPEPTSLVLTAIAGLAGLLVYGWRRSR